MPSNTHTPLFSPPGKVADAEDVDCIACDEGCKQCERSEWSESFAFTLSLSASSQHLSQCIVGAKQAVAQSIVPVERFTLPSTMCLEHTEL